MSLHSEDFGIYHLASIVIATMTAVVIIDKEGGDLMSYLNSDRGQKFFKQYLKKFNGGSQRVYRSEIQQFFDFRNSDLTEVTKDTLNAYRKHIARKHSPKTTKRKFSILTRIIHKQRARHQQVFVI